MTTQPSIRAFKKSVWTAAATGAFALSVPTHANPPGAPIGLQERVNTTTEGDQRQPQVAMSAAGTWVVTWNSADQDGSGWGIYAQRYGFSGPIGPEFRVNGTVTGEQRLPRIAMNAAGDFVIAWRSNEQDGDGYGVYARRYDRNGTSLGDEFRVNTTTTGHQFLTDIAMNAAGRFVVTWISDSQEGIAYGQRFSSTGSPAGGEIPLGSAGDGDEYPYAVAIDPDGDFAVLFEPANGEVRARAFKPYGTPKGDSFQVSVGNAAAGGDIAFDSDGDIVAAWSTYYANGGTYGTLYFGVYTRQFSPSGVPRDGARLIIETVNGDSVAEALAIDATGSAAVTFRGTGSDVYVARLHNDVKEEPVRVNSLLPGVQRASAVAMDADGDMVIAWQTQTENGYDIAQQRYNGFGAVNLALSQTQSVSPTPGYAVSGGQVTYRFKVANRTAAPTVVGIGTATGIQVTHQIDSGAYLSDVVGTGWTCDLWGKLLTCDYIRALAAQQVSPPLLVTLDMPKSFTPFVSRGTVSNTQYDAVAFNNRASVTTFLCDPNATVDQIVVTSDTVIEGKIASIQVARQGGVCAPASVKYQTLDGAAKAPADYTAATGTLSWAAGEQGVKRFQVGTIADALVEGREKLTLDLFDGGSAVLTDATLTIRDP